MRKIVFQLICKKHQKKLSLPITNILCRLSADVGWRKVKNKLACPPLQSGISSFKYCPEAAKENENTWKYFLNSSNVIVGKFLKNINIGHVIMVILSH